MNELDEDALREATLLLNKRLAEGNLYGVTRDIIITYLKVSGQHPIPSKAKRIEATQ